MNKLIEWSKDDELLEVVRLLMPYMTYADIGRLLKKNRRTIHYAAKTYGLDKEENRKGKIPLIIIKSRDKYDKDLLSLKDLEK